MVMNHENGQLSFVTYWNTIKELEFGDMCVRVSHFLSRKSINKCSGLIVAAIMNKTCLDHTPGL